MVNEIGVFAVNDAVSGISIGAFSSLISLALIYIYKIPDIRRTAIEVLATGYYENFLINVIEQVSKVGGDYRIIIVLPSFELIERPVIYWSRFRGVIERLGFKLIQETTDENFGRNILLIQKAENPPLPIRLDLPTTMRMLRKILELESDMPAGRGVEYRWWKDRFIELRADFKKTIEQYISENDWGHIVFVNGDTQDEFEREITRIMAEVESGIDRLG